MAKNASKVAAALVAPLLARKRPSAKMGRFIEHPASMDIGFGALAAPRSLPIYLLSYVALCDLDGLGVPDLLFLSLPFGGPATSHEEVRSFAPLPRGRVALSAQEVQSCRWHYIRCEQGMQ